MIGTVVFLPLLTLSEIFKMQEGGVGLEATASHTHEASHMAAGGTDLFKP